MSEAVTLAPCPFCGVKLAASEALATRSAAPFIHPSDHGHECPATSVVIWSNAPERIAAWNRRALNHAEGEPVAWPDREAVAVETGWLIEHPDEPKWMTLKPPEALWGVVWTADSLEALRFARRDDAEDYYAAHLDDMPGRITEHQWSGALLSASDGAGPKGGEG